ncbi:hypothetical protein NM688_g2203 [Phlebia brevispora]|uniref:Uncharacterized protein n=1 Tax=Phlebia brevispora TaxID=194682 RepID=A0ACC1T919_9APHY|nr:hypothetical protein NM688_g2203 [Phlebia brevispora]
MLNGQVQLMLEQLAHEGSLLFRYPTWWDLAPESLDGRFHVPVQPIKRGRYIRFYGSDAPSLSKVLSLHGNYRGSRNLIHAEPFIVQFTWPGYTAQGSLQVHSGTSLLHLISRVACYVQLWLFNPARAGFAPICALPETNGWHPRHFSDCSVYLMGLAETVDEDGDLVWAPDLLVKTEPVQIAASPPLRQAPEADMAFAPIYGVQHHTLSELSARPSQHGEVQLIVDQDVEMHEAYVDTRGLTATTAMSCRMREVVNENPRDTLSYGNIDNCRLSTTFPLNRDVHWGISYPNQMEVDEDP